MHLCNGQVGEPKGEGEQGTEVTHDLVQTVASRGDRLRELALVECVAEVCVLWSGQQWIALEREWVRPGIALNGTVERKLLLTNMDHTV